MEVIQLLVLTSLLLSLLLSSLYGEVVQDDFSGPEWLEFRSFPGPISLPESLPLRIGACKRRHMMT